MLTAFRAPSKNVQIFKKVPPKDLKVDGDGTLLKLFFFKF